MAFFERDTPKPTSSLSMITTGAGELAPFFLHAGQGHLQTKEQ
jgi:hypothetical protein